MLFPSHSFGGLWSHQLPECRIVLMAAPIEDTMIPNEVVTGPRRQRCKLAEKIQRRKQYMGDAHYNGGLYEMDSLAHIGSYYRL